jgi:hypothetical protein
MTTPPVLVGLLPESPPRGGGLDRRTMCGPGSGASEISYSVSYIGGNVTILAVPRVEGREYAVTAVSGLSQTHMRKDCQYNRGRRVGGVGGLFAGMEGSAVGLHSACLQNMSLCMWLNRESRVQVCVYERVHNSAAGMHA